MQTCTNRISRCAPTCSRRPSPAAIRLLYWSRLAYQEEDELDNEYVGVKSALGLFGLEQ